MKHGKIIIIKHPSIRNLRNTLRLLLKEITLEQGKEFWNWAIKYGDNKEALRAEGKIDIQAKKNFNINLNKRLKLRDALNKSICYCPQCSSMDSDMAYNKPDERWYCIKCFNELNFDPNQVKLKFTKNQLKTFLNKLAGPDACQYDGFKSRCGGKEFTFAREILNSMNISVKDQEKFLELCKYFGGYCDCEILMNAAPHLLNHFSK